MARSLQCAYQFSQLIERTVSNQFLIHSRAIEWSLTWRTGTLGEDLASHECTQHRYRRDQSTQLARDTDRCALPSDIEDPN